jgi:hypothetical protein
MSAGGDAKRRCFTCKVEFSLRDPHWSNVPIEALTGGIVVKLDVDMCNPCHAAMMAAKRS